MYILNETIDEKIKKFFSEIDFGEFEEYFFTHRDEETRQHFNLTHGVYNKIKKDYGLRRSVEQMNASRKSKWNSKMEDIHAEWTANITKEDLYDYFVINNHYVDECLAYFNIPYTQFNWLCNNYGIKKPVGLNTIHSRRTKLELYGDENYNNRGKAKQTCLEIYGVDNPFKDKEKIRQSYINKYGVDHPMKVDSVKQKMISNTDYEALITKTHQTNLERYGVSNAATLPECKQRIRDSLTRTFMKKYGCTCYWTSKDRKKAYNCVHSKPNEAFANLLNTNYIAFEREFPLIKKVFDFKVDKNLIEINPSATHNSTWGIFTQEGLDKYYHRDKSQLAEDNGYRCIHVWDWDDKDKIVKLLLPRKRIFARKCEVRDVDLSTTREYLNTYHLQGSARDNIRIGLYYNNELVSIMTFGKPRYNKKCEYELIRYCSSYNIIGGAEKLFTHFVRTYNPTTIVSYCDKSKFTGRTYLNLGFKFEANNVSKHWYNPITNVHITDNFLRQRGFDQIFNTDYGKGTSNEVLMLEAGFVEIFDAGQSTYIWVKGD